MSTSRTLPDRRNMREIQPDQWLSFLAEFTRENRGAHARLEVLASGADAGSRVEIENRPFDGVSADIKDRERTVWISFASKPEDHFAHGVHDASLLRILPPANQTGPVLEIESRDGTKTILQLENVPAHELSPGQRR